MLKKILDLLVTLHVVDPTSKEYSDAITELNKVSGQHLTLAEIGSLTVLLGHTIEATGGTHPVMQPVFTPVAPLQAPAPSDKPQPAVIHVNTDGLTDEPVPVAPEATIPPTNVPAPVEEPAPETAVVEPAPVEQSENPA